MDSKQLKIFLVFISAWLIFILLKLNLEISFFELASLGFILTITTLLFSFLVGYYLKSRYDRYIMIRDSHILRHSKCFNLIENCRFFSINNKLLKKLYNQIRDVAIINELALWKEGYIEEAYYKKLYDLIKIIKVKNDKDKELFKTFLITLDDINDLSRKLTSLGGDKLGFIHWTLLASLASVIITLTFSIPIKNLLGTVILMIFPPIILLSVYIIYAYQYMIFLKEGTSMEINQKLFDEIGKKRFYKKSRLHFVRPQIRKNKNLYRTEDNLKGEEKDIYLDYLDKDFYVDRITKKKIHY